MKTLSLVPDTSKRNSFNCLNCERPFKSSKPHAKYCNKRCASAWHHRNRKPEEVSELTGTKWSIALSSEWLSKAVA